MRKNTHKDPTFTEPIAPVVALKPRDACRYLSISPSTLKRLVRDAGLPYTRFLKGREKRFMIRDLDALLLKGLQTMANKELAK